jgi:hypothetical protein
MYSVQTGLAPLTDRLRAVFFFLPFSASKPAQRPTYWKILICKSLKSGHKLNSRFMDVSSERGTRMKGKALSVLAMQLAGSIAANAQITTLEYQGNVMSGISTYLPSGFVTSTLMPPLPTASFTGTFTASVTLSGSISANDLLLVSYGVNLNGSNGTSFALNNISAGQAPVIPEGAPDFCSATGSCIDLTTAKGAITGATIEFLNTPYHGSQSEVTIGPTGDSFSYLFASINGTCENMFYPVSSSSEYSYPGATINPCTVKVSNTKAGGWTVTRTPEIDPASAASGLTLLLASLAVLRGRRSRMPSI